MKPNKVWVLVVAVFLVSALGTYGTGQSSAAPPSAGTSKVTGSPYASKSYWVGDEPVELTFHWTDYGMVFSPEIPVIKKACEMTNVRLKGTLPSSMVDSEQAFSLMIASGKYPDLIANWRENFELYLDQNVFMELSDLIDKHAPNLKKHFADYPDDRIQSLIGGKRVYIGNYYEGNVAMIYHIRKDWLDKLNLPVPETYQQYYDTLKAFRDRDPNGNGKADEIPFFQRGGYLVGLYEMFGARIEWFEGRDGKVHHGLYDESYRTAASNVARWYREKLIDMEVFTRGGRSRDILFAADQGGATHDWPASTSNYNLLMKDKVPGFNLIQILPPRDINGEIVEYSNRENVNGMGWAMAAACSNPVAAIKFIDFWFSPEGKLLHNFGLEGVHYEMKDGRPLYKSAMYTSGKDILTRLMEDGIAMRIGSFKMGEAEAQWMQPEAAAVVREYVSRNLVDKIFPVKSLTFTDAERKVLTEKWSAISTYMKETQQNWILGGESVEAGWSAYLGKLKSMGMDEVLAVYNAAYKRLK